MPKSWQQLPSLQVFLVSGRARDIKNAESTRKHGMVLVCGRVGDPSGIEKLPPEPRRHHRGGHRPGVFQYNCESLRAPDRLYELMAMAKHTGADVACLQGTLFDGFGEWTKHGYHFFSLRSTAVDRAWTEYSHHEPPCDLIGC